MGRRAVQGFVSSDLVSLKKENNKHNHVPVSVCTRSAQGWEGQGEGAHTGALASGKPVFLSFHSSYPFFFNCTAEIKTNLQLKSAMSLRFLTLSFKASSH